MAEDKKTDTEAVKWGVLSDRAGDNDRIIHSVSQFCHRDQSRDQFVTCLVSLIPPVSRNIRCSRVLTSTKHIVIRSHRVDSSERSQRLLDSLFFAPSQNTNHQVSPFLLSLNSIQPPFRFFLTPTLNLHPDESQPESLLSSYDPPRFNKDIPSVVRRHETMRLEMRDQRVLVAAPTIVRSDVQLVAEMVDVKTLVGQPVFRRGEVFDEQLSR